MEVKFLSNKKISIILLIASILIQLLFLTLLVMQIVGRGLNQTPNIVSSGQCLQCLIVKYRSIQAINVNRNFFLFAGIVVGLLLTLIAIFFSVKNFKQQQITLKSFNLFIVNYVSFSLQSVFSAILFGYQVSFRLQNEHCQLTALFYTTAGLIISLIILVLSIFCQSFLVYVINNFNKNQEKNKISSQISQQQQELASQFQRKTKQMRQLLLNRNQLNLTSLINYSMEQEQENQFKIQVQYAKQKQQISQQQIHQQNDFNVDGQNLRDNSFYQDKFQFQSLKSQAQSMSNVPRFVKQNINQLKQVGFQIQYVGDSQKKVKFSKGYPLQMTGQKKNNQSNANDNPINDKFLSLIVNLNNSNNPLQNQETVSYGQQQNQDQIALNYKQSKEEKAKKRQIKRKLFQLKMKQKIDQPCPFINMIDQDEFNQKQALQRRVFQDTNQLQDFTAGAELCLFRPKFDQVLKDNDLKMQDMYAQTTVYYRKQYLERMQYQHKFLQGIKESYKIKNKQLFRNNPDNLHITSNEDSDASSRTYQKNKKQRSKMLEQMRGKNSY